MELTIRSL